MNFAENLSEKVLNEKPKITDSEIEILQKLAADLDGLIFSRDENLTDRPFKISLNSQKTKTVLRRGNAEFTEFSAKDFQNLKPGEKFNGIPKENLQKIWEREVEKVKQNLRDSRDDEDEKIADPWENSNGTISIPFDKNGDEILPTHEIPAGEIEIIFGKNFSFFDFPDLILEIQNLRNEFYKNPKNVDAEKRKFFEKLGKAEILLSNFAREMAIKYEKSWFEIQKSAEIPPEIRRKILWLLGEFNLKLHEIFSAINLNETTENIDFVAKNFRQKILQIVDEKNPDEEIGKILQSEIENDFFGAIQNAGEKELLRATEFSEKLVENFAGEKFEKIKKIYDQKFSDLENFQNPFSSISDAQNQLKTAREKNDKNAETEILQNIFRVTNILIFSQKIIPYKSGAISFNEFAQSSTGNCMLAQSVAPHLFLQKIFGVETKQISTFGHSILGAVSPENKIWDFQENEITNLENKPGIQVDENTGEWFLVENFDRGNIAGTLDWQQFDFKNTAEKVAVLQNAIAISPENPDLRNSLGIAFWNLANENPTEKKYFCLAEAEFLIAVNLTRGLHAVYLYQLFCFYNYFSKTEKAKKIQKKIQNLNNETVAKAAERFSDFEKDIFEA